MEQFVFYIRLYRARSRFSTVLLIKDELLSLFLYGLLTSQLQLNENI